MKVEMWHSTLVDFFISIMHYIYHIMETKRNISYLEFRDFFISLGCFSIHQVKIWNADFNRNNLGRWEKQGKIIRLRQGYYAFPSLLKQGDAPFYLANKMYAPSYISLESALSFHGMIPEGVIPMTSITTRKTKKFHNAFGDFTYQTEKPELLFGYTIEQSTRSNGWSILLATPEKALLDLLYLRPHYNSLGDMQQLRLDVDFMNQELNTDRLDEYVTRFGSKILEQRVSCLKGAYL